MKVVSPQEMARIESLAYAEGASESDFMEKAGAGVAHYVEGYARKHHRQEHVVLLCGKGNNGGDAFVAGRYLLHRGFEVSAVQCCGLEECSPLCQENGRRFLQSGGFIHRFDSSKLSFPSKGILVDGLFGMGFKGAVVDPYAALIQAANDSELPILASDIPSGLNGATGEALGACIDATETIFLGLPKTGFFLAQGWNLVGKLRHVDFGLPRKCLDAAAADLLLTGPEDWNSLLPPIVRNRHKYQTGFVVGLAGSVGMPGAAIMASFAALRGGAGIVKLLHPDGMRGELANCPVEIIRVAYQSNEKDKIVELLNSATAAFVGPGIGRTPQAQKLLQDVLPRLSRPCVLDADALTLIAQEGFALPPQAILTPHHGEMARLLGLSAAPMPTLEFLQQCQNYVEKHSVTLVLKGGPTFLFSPGMSIQISARGDPGLAKAGTGDVLTGLLAALLAQRLQPLDAAILGTALHGIAGEVAVEEKTAFCLVAWDVIEALPRAYSTIMCAADWD